MRSIDIQTLKPCPYSDEKMEKLKQKILMQSTYDYKSNNRKCRYAFKKAETSRQHNRWIEKGYGYANEMVRELAFIVSDWFRVLTEGKSPQRTIFNKMISITNEYAKTYVMEEIEKYAIRKNIQLPKLYE